MSDKVKVFLTSKKVKEQKKLQDSLRGKSGKSAYEIWLSLGNTGTEQEFLESLRGKDGEVVEQEIIREIVREQPIIKTEIVKEIVKEKVIQPKDGEDGDDGVSVVSASVDNRGDLIIKYSDGRIQNAGHVQGRDGRSVSGGSGAALRSLNQRAYIIKSDNYTTKKNDYYIEVDTSGVTVTLGVDSINKGKEVHVDNSSDGDCFVTPIAGSETITLHSNEGSYFVYNGTNWRIK